MISQSGQMNYRIFLCDPLSVQAQKANFSVGNRSQQKAPVVDSRQPIGQENEWTTRKPNPYQH